VNSVDPAQGRDKHQAVQEELWGLGCLTPGDGTHRLSRNVGKQLGLPNPPRNYLEEGRPHLHRGESLKSRQVTGCCECGDEPSGSTESEFLD
jgi:hypothetical protein